MHRNDIHGNKEVGTQINPTCKGRNHVFERLRKFCYTTLKSDKYFEPNIRIEIQNTKSVGFLDTKNEHPEKQIRKEILLTTPLKTKLLVW